MPDVLILYNKATTLETGVESDLISEQEIDIIVPLVTELLRARGYDTDTMLADLDVWEKLRLQKSTIGIVLNLAEAFGGGNTNETVVPAILEGLKIPFTGASALNMNFSQDKEKTKLVLKTYGIPSAPHQLFREGTEPLRRGLRFPLIVKPVRQEASIGIYEDSVVTNREELYRKVQESIQRYGQPTLVEQFIRGREISVGMFGNGSELHVFPPLEFLFEDAPSELQQIRSYEYKWGGKKEQMVRADLPQEMIDKLVEYSRIAFTATDCRDYARMDFRVDDQGNIYLLEVNYNPGIGPNTHGLNNTLTMMASFEGMTFEDLVEQVVLIALNRYRKSNDNPNPNE